MPREYLKKAPLTSTSDAADVRATVQEILDAIEAGGDEKALEYAARFDQYDGPVVLSRADIDAATELVPEKLKRDIQFAHDNVRRFAEAQKETLKDIEVEIVPGLVAGQKSIPCKGAGCYVPGGRYKPHRVGDHDRDNCQGSRLPAYCCMFATASGCRHCACDHLHRRSVRCRYDPGSWRCAGRLLP